MINEVIVVSVMALVSAQVLKYPISLFKKGKDNTPLSIVFSTGSMPSSHTALVVAMSLEVGMVSGYNSSVYGLAFIMMLIIIHDAIKVRGESGKQAQVINYLVEDLKQFSTLFDVKLNHVQRENKLKELIGHSTSEVIGGIVVGIVVFGIYNIFIK